VHSRAQESMQSLLDRVNRTIAERRWHVLTMETLLLPDTAAVARGEIEVRSLGLWPTEGRSVMRHA
jgi:hypothetical protein